MSEKANEEGILKNKYFIGQSVYFIDCHGRPQEDTVERIWSNDAELLYDLAYSGEYHSESELSSSEKEALKKYKRDLIEEYKSNIELTSRDLERVIAELKELEEADD